MPPGPTVAVAVVSWNTRDLLDRCLRALRPSGEAGLAEVWVVDNGSSDGSPALVRERLAVYRDAGVGTLMVSPMAWTYEDRLTQLRLVAELAA